MLKEPIDIVCGNLDREIGEPKDIHVLLEANGQVNFEQELPIPRPAGTSVKNGEIAKVVGESAFKAGSSVGANGVYVHHTNGKHLK